MSQFVEFVESQVKSSKELRDQILAAVFDDEVPMSSVDDDLEGADVRVLGYDRVQRVVTTQLRVPWTGTLAIDDEGEMTESGVVIGTVQFKHRGRALELVGGHLDVVYDTLFTVDEDD